MMFLINIAQVKQALDDSANGIEKYIELLRKYQMVNVCESSDFRRLFNNFWRMRQRTQSYYDNFFAYFEENKKNFALDFNTIIHSIYDKTMRVEGIFCSKMLAMINPDKPVLDTIVMNHFKINKPLYKKNREKNINDWIDCYVSISESYKSFLLTDQAKEWINLFNTQYPNAKISDTKKIDFILWQIRN